MTTARNELITLLSSLSQEAPELRMGQLLVNLATHARGASAESVWDAEDEELIVAAKNLLEHYRQRNAEVA